MAELLYKLASKIPVIREIQKVYAKANALEQLYEQGNIAQGLIPTKYYQQVDPGSGNVKGFSAVCLCGREHRIFSLHECFAHDLMCPACKMEINLLKYVGAVDASGKFLVKAQEVRALVSKLPVRPANVGGAAPRFLSSDGDGAPADNWDGHKDNSRQKAFDAGDPGMCGPGF